MGDIADQIVNGECCELCGTPCDGEPVGWNYICEECGEGDIDTNQSKVSLKPKSTCPICKRKIKSVGLLNHVESEHGKHLASVIDTVLKNLEGVED